MSAKVKLTKAAVDALQASDKVVIVRDADLQGFGVRITPQGAKSFIAERKVNGKTVRVTIGRVGPWTLAQARSEAVQLLARMDRGENPNEKETAAPAPEPAKPVDLSLRALLDAYLKERASVQPAMKPRTANSYRYLHEVCFADWMPAPFTSITKAMVVEKMAEMTKDRGPTTANNGFRALRAVLNWAIDNDGYADADGVPIYEANPVRELARRRLWNRDRRLTRVLEMDTLPAWWRAVDERVTLEAWPDRAEVIRDFWRFLLLTGMRSEHGARIKVSGWSAKYREITLEDPKNRDEVFILPVGDWVAERLNRRRALSEAAGSEWLFPAPKREAGYTTSGHEIRKAMVIASGIVWSTNDLRRTFASAVDRLDVSAYLMKRVMGHRTKDVTAGYIQHDRERIRSVMQRVETALLAAAKVPSGK